jgi:aspartate racemase
MKTLGLIGGTSWVSTIDYYKLINQMVNSRLGGVNAATLLLYSVNFSEFLPPSDEAGWRYFTSRFIAIARKLESAGAEALVLCANTPHKIAPEIAGAITIPLIHIAEVTAREVASHKHHTVGLLGTRFTMQEPFYHETLAKHGINTLIPKDADREYIHQTILGDFARDIFTPEHKARYLRIIDDLENAGAQAIILGCTEIPILIKPRDCRLPLFDTTVLHARAAVDFALA